MPIVPKQFMHVGGLVALVGAACYAAIVYPMNHAAEYRRIQEETRKNIDREQIQPGGMRIWSDPFKERVKEEPLFIQRARKQE